MSAAKSTRDPRTSWDCSASAACIRSARWATPEAPQSGRPKTGTDSSTPSVALHAAAPTTGASRRHPGESPRANTTAYSRNGQRRADHHLATRNGRKILYSRLITRLRALPSPRNLPAAPSTRPRTQSANPLLQQAIRSESYQCTTRAPRCGLREGPLGTTAYLGNFVAARNHSLITSNWSASKSLHPISPGDVTLSHAHVQLVATAPLHLDPLTAPTAVHQDATLQRGRRFPRVQCRAPRKHELQQK